VIVLDASAAVQACLAAGGFDLFGNERLMETVSRNNRLSLDVLVESM
jgi:hypothetical protein